MIDPALNVLGTPRTLGLQDVAGYPLNGAVKSSSGVGLVKN